MTWMLDLYKEMGRPTIEVVPKEVIKIEYVPA